MVWAKINKSIFSYELERDTFNTAFVIRKLIECRKIADSISDLIIRLPYYDALDEGRGRYLYDVMKHYDFESDI